MTNFLIKEGTSRNCFLLIKWFLHINDNLNSSVEDKVWKLKPYLDHLKTKSLKTFKPIQEISYDETMVKYYGRHGCEQFLRVKQIRFGYKVRALNNTDGCSIYLKYTGEESLLEEILSKQKLVFVLLS